MAEVKFTQSFSCEGRCTIRVDPAGLVVQTQTTQALMPDGGFESPSPTTFTVCLSPSLNPVTVSLLSYQ